MSLNRVQLIGNLTRDPELRQIPGGQTVATLSIATNFTWSDSMGQKQEKAEFHNVVAWRKLAEICGQYLRKGSKIFIEGRLQTRDWEGEDGVKRYKTEIVADNMIMLDRKGGTDGGGSAFMGENQAFNGGIKKSQNNNYDNQQPVSAQDDVVMQEEVTIDDLPF